MCCYNGFCVVKMDVRASVFHSIMLEKITYLSKKINIDVQRTDSSCKGFSAFGLKIYYPTTKKKTTRLQNEKIKIIKRKIRNNYLCAVILQVELVAYYLLLAQGLIDVDF